MWLFGGKIYGPQQGHSRPAWTLLCSSVIRPRQSESLQKIHMDCILGRNSKTWKYHSLPVRKDKYLRKSKYSHNSLELLGKGLLIISNIKSSSTTQAVFTGSPLIKSRVDFFHSHPVSSDFLLSRVPLSDSVSIQVFFSFYLILVFIFFYYFSVLFSLFFLLSFIFSSIFSCLAISFLSFNRNSMVVIKD